MSRPKPRPTPSRARPTAAGLFGATLLLASAACTGKIGDTTPRGTVGMTNGSTDAGSTTPTPEVVPPFAPAPAALRRLTLSEYVNSVRDLLGDVTITTDLEVDTPLYGFSTVGATSLSIGPRAAEQYESSALDLAAQVFRDDARRTAFVGCAPADASDPCIRTFLSTFGRRAWRRPLDTEELDRWANVVTTIADSQRSVWSGLELATAGLLESPNFLYRVELGTTDPSDSTRRKYDGYEIATRLSYFLWNSTPDDALLDAAANGALATAGGVADQAERMLSSPTSSGRAKAQGAIVRFFDEHFKLDRLEGLTKDAATFPQLSETLGASMREEIHAMVANVVVDRNDDLRTLFSTRETFVNAELARLYGLPAIDADGFTPVTLAENGARAGIFTTAGFLALNAHASATSPTRRGRFIRQSILCQEIPPPPPGVSTQLPVDEPNAPPETLRQRLERLHHKNPTCAGCHLRMDPIGFGFESFDAIGAYRTTDNTLPVDPRGDLDGKAFKSAKELAAIVRDHPNLGPCLSRMAYRYATGHLETTGETATLKSLAEMFEANGFRFRDLMIAIVSSDGFRYAAAE